jgi:beta-fructofuranosidase
MNSERHRRLPRDLERRYLLEKLARAVEDAKDMITPRNTSRIALLLALGIASMLGSALTCLAAEKPPLVVSGSFTNIYDPSIGEKEKWYINDHCFFHAPDGTWHLFGITHEEPAAPLQERILAHATAKTLLQQPWDKQAPALAYAPEAPWNEEHLWAPYVVQHGGLFYMFYCAGAKDHSNYKLHLATSKDLKTWARHSKNPIVVDGFDARDPFVMSHAGKWILYYTANSSPTGGYHVVKCVTSTNLVDWGDTRTVYTDPSQGTYGGPTESPFVVRRGASYYLFVGPRPDYDGTDVFVSTDPFSWKIEDKVGHIPSHAAEVVRDRDGKWYLSRCGWGKGGVYLAPLTWQDGLDDKETNLPVPK